MRPSILKKATRFKSSCIEQCILGDYELFKDDKQLRAEECFDHLTYFNNLLTQAVGYTDIYAGADAKIADFGLKGVGRTICNKYEGQLNTGEMMCALLHKVYSTGTLVLAFPCSKKYKAL